MNTNELAFVVILKIKWEQTRNKFEQNKIEIHKKVCTPL